MSNDLLYETWRCGSTVVTVPLNLLTWFWLQPGPYTSVWWRREGGRDLLSWTKCWLCALCGCGAQHTGITQDAFCSSAQGPWQQPQLSHTHKQRGSHSLLLAPSDFPLQLQKAKVLRSWGARPDSPGHGDFRRHEYSNTEWKWSGKAC